MANLPDAARPLYERVKEYVLGNLRSGVWAREQQIPSENDLVATLGVSRMTVHRALRELTAEGILIRIQGVGTFVAVPRTQSALIEINNIAEEIAARGHRHRAEVLLVERIATSPELTLAFEFPRRRDVHHSLVVHFENDLAVQLEERFVNLALVPDYDRQDFTRTTTFAYLMQTTPVTEVEHVISAIAADSRTAQHLDIALGSPCLLLRRRTWTGAQVATVSRLTYVGGTYTLGSRYKPTDAGGGSVRSP
jgi:GntR family histidine utilization transcriptional repressor